MTDEQENMRNRDKNLCNEEGITIRAREQSYTFEKGTYNEYYLGSLIEKKAYDSIVEEASKVMGQSWSKKRTNDQIKLPRGVILLAILSVVLTIVYMITLYLSTTSEDGTALFVISIICVSAGSIIALFLSIYNFCRKIGKFKSLDEIIKEDLDQYLNKFNVIYSGKLQWKYNMDKKWIELKILKPGIQSEEKRNFIREEDEDAEYDKYENKDGRQDIEMTEKKIL